MKDEAKVQAAAELIVELGKEAEAPGHAATDKASLVLARAVLRRWIDGVEGVVVNPAMGRVTVIHRGGQASSIGSAELAFMMSAAGVTQSG